jgi:gp6-like head-tail connector protein
MSYVTLAEFKAAVEITDTADDADIQRALDAAYDWINHYTGRTFNAVDATASATRVSRSLSRPTSTTCIRCT